MDSDFQFTQNPVRTTTSALLISEPLQEASTRAGDFSLDIVDPLSMSEPSGPETTMSIILFPASASPLLDWLPKALRRAPVALQLSALSCPHKVHPRLDVC